MKIARPIVRCLKLLGLNTQATRRRPTHFVRCSISLLKNRRTISVLRPQRMFRSTATLQFRAPDNFTERFHAAQYLHPENTRELPEETDADYVLYEALKAKYVAESTSTDEYDAAIRRAVKESGI